METSGTEVENPTEVEEEEVEYVEEVVEYEEEVEEEVDVEESEEPGPEEKVSEATKAEEPAAPPPAPADSAADPEEDDADAPPPPSTSAKESPPEPSGLAEPSSTAEPPGSPPAASSSSAESEAKLPGVELDLKQLEAQAAKVAKEVSQVALDKVGKLTAGLRSAFGSAESAAVAGAGASLTKLAGGLSSWWGSLDPAPAPVRNETAERVAASNKASGELQALFGLSPEENLVEHFKCKLLQTYACSHNNHTPAIQMAFQGTLYVTDRHTCFSVEERGRKVPFKVPHASVVRATRQRPARKGDLSDVLKLELSSGQWLAFKDFDSGSALDSALALVEHLTEAES